MQQENPRFQPQAAGRSNPRQLTPTGTPSQEPSTGLQAQQTPPIGDLAAQLADLQARQSTLEAQQAQTGQVQPTTPSPVAQQMSPTLQPSSPQAQPTQRSPATQPPNQQPQQPPAQHLPAQQPMTQGQLQGLPARLRSMMGVPIFGQRQGQGQPHQLGQGGSPSQPQQSPMHHPMMQQQQPQHAQLSQQSPQGLVGQGSPMQGGSGQIGQMGGQTEPQVRQRRVRQPPVDILDEGEHLILEIEMPGASKEDIRLTGQRNVIQLNAPTKEHREEENLLQSERGQVYYRRSIPLGIEVDSEDIEARFEDGILRVKAPKRDPTSGPQRIEVQ